MRREVLLQFEDRQEDGEDDRAHEEAEEADERELLTLPRLVVPYDRRSAGYLQQLIDLVNALPYVGPVPSPA